MKKLLLSIVLVLASVTLFAQDFNVYVTNINGYAKGYSNAQVADLYYNYYGVPQSTLNQYYNNFDNNWGNVALALEFSRVLGIPVPDIFGVYRDGRSNGQGWGVMAQRYGIKPGSAAFHRMKNTMGRSSKTWRGIYGDYGKRKDPKVAKKGVYIFDNGVIKTGNSKKSIFQKNANSQKVNNKGNKGKGNNGRGNNGNKGRGNR